MFDRVGGGGGLRRARVALLISSKRVQARVSACSGGERAARIELIFGALESRVSNREHLLSSGGSGSGGGQSSGQGWPSRSAAPERTSRLIVSRGARARGRQAHTRARRRRALCALCALLCARVNCTRTCCCHSQPARPLARFFLLRGAGMWRWNAARAVNPLVGASWRRRARSILSPREQRGAPTKTRDAGARGAAGTRKPADVSSWTRTTRHSPPPRDQRQSCQAANSIASLTRKPLSETTH